MKEAKNRKIGLYFLLVLAAYSAAQVALQVFYGDIAWKVAFAVMVLVGSFALTEAGKQNESSNLH